MGNPQRIFLHFGFRRRQRRSWSGLSVAESPWCCSPKSGGAISRTTSEPWSDRLLRLPWSLPKAATVRWLVRPGPRGRLSADGPFLLCHVLEPHEQGRPDARDGLINAVNMHRAKVGCGPQSLGLRPSVTGHSL
jgi:hypothetical protein